MQRAPDPGRRLALLVATSTYSDPDLRQLRAPGRDASDLAEVLRDPRIGGFNVQVLVNGPSGEVQEAIEDFCTDRHPDDQLLIYLSCHGVLDSYGRLYYTATNTRRQRLAATAIAAAWLNERLEDCRARRQILVLDCCHSGAFARGAKGDADLALQQRFEPHGRGRVVLTASRSTEYSFEGGRASGEGVPSVFTHAIVNGLRTGDADRDKDGLITVTDLYQYVYANVRAVEPRQTPELWTYGAEGNLLVAHSIRGAVIEPEPLPEDLRMTLESPRRRVRETGVAELAELLDAAGPGLALAARRALERIADEDHPQVAALARIAVAAPAGAAADQVHRELTDRAHREQRARQEALDHAIRHAEHQVSHGAESHAPPPHLKDAQSQTDKERVPQAPSHDTAASVGSVNQASSRNSKPHDTVGQGRDEPWIIQFWALPFSMLRSKRMTPRPRGQYALLYLASLGVAIGFTVGSAQTIPRSGPSQMFGWFAAFSYIWAFIMLGRAVSSGRVRRWFWRLPPPWLDAESSSAPAPKPAPQESARRARQQPPRR